MKKLFLILLVSLICRLFLFPVAHHGDLNNNISWGNLALKYGLNGYYEKEVWDYSKPNQPPLTILTFAATSYVYNFVKDSSWYLNNNLSFFPSPFIWFWEGKGMDLMVKLPGIIADLVLGYFIFKFFDERKNKKAILFASIWLFNPVIWYNSSIWGQTDSIVNLLGFISIIFLLKKDIVKSFVFLTLSILFKGSLSLFVPVILAYAIFQRYSIKKWLYAFGFSLITVLVTSIWFHPSFDFPIWFVNLYTQRIFPGEIGYLTANSFNFWWLVDSGKTLDSAIFLGLSARIWGIIVNLIGLGGIIYWLKKGISEKKLFISLMIVSLISFLFMTRIHERYLYPFFIPGAIVLSFIPSIVIPYVLLSLANLFNLYHLFWAPGIPFVEKLYLKPLFMSLFSYLNILSFIWILINIFRNKLREEKSL